MGTSRSRSSIVWCWAAWRISRRSPSRKRRRAPTASGAKRSPRANAPLAPVLVVRAEEDVPIDVGDGGELRRGRGQRTVDCHDPDADAGRLDLVGERIDEIA